MLLKILLHIEGKCAAGRCVEYNIFVAAAVAPANILLSPADGINGIIALSADELIKMARPNVTLEELYEACSDWEDEVSAMITKAGGRTYPNLL